jgi:hypothetical protein
MSKKSHGPSLVPCGIPALTGFQFEKLFRESFTLCNLSLKKSEIQLKVDGFRPNS